MIFARNVYTIRGHDIALNDPAKIAKMREDIKEGDTYIFKQVVPEEFLAQIRNYLIQIGQNSLPNYHRIERDCPNFHRINRWDLRSYVRGCFHQFVFFPWNEDIFDLFTVFRPIYQMKNLLSNLPKDKFLGKIPEDNCTARLAFQLYPSGLGGLNKHTDPVDAHQLTVPTMLLSQKGVDFHQGGSYVEKENGERIYLDDICGWGDVIYFNAQICHGVERIDPKVKTDWLSFQGRWMLLFAVNKLSDNRSIGNSVDLEANGNGEGA